MKKLFYALGIAIVVYFVWRMYVAYKAVKDAKQAAVHAAEVTVKAPVNAMSTVMAAGGFVWDVLRGEGLSNSAKIFSDTTGGIWEN